MTRREMLGMASVAVVAVALGGGIFLNRDEEDDEPPSGDFPVRKTKAQWRAQLGAASYAILREAGTEPPYSSPLLEEHRQGIFACLGCDTHAFGSATKFDSHTGWPSFWDVLPNAIVKRTDLKIGVPRTEVLCKTCGGHLGHVFDDGPKPTGLRYCMNGLALKFLPGLS
ncbi:MAG: peptide-methionine (R)-S-oxide reductase MsrB [Candidatus Andeanibacterium colombiense]|uniref:peptide-methionine (R)-S-oxide reductase n=1 Tax=Candidatus Andeanibacterium colombiense TaxID=3121345 RepID=A0AAJ5X9P3_9SPHN|nr:MAG: peptide-methionine (R)-S-oxide reductase MsrB [Sphingomonadaceae bacterium]